MRSLEAYLDLTRKELLGKLSIVSLELMHAYDQIGFIKSQELEQKRDVWLGLPPDESIQKKDREAAYAAAGHTINLAQVEAERNVLIEERNFLTLLLNHG